ncbi:MAG TPA: PmoA family protein [Tepidisphaeraceae bacterium]|jgi:hypothetical protein|nr:PmoA family protein [Tepidisphaeraceae bacterium]
MTLTFNQSRDGRIDLHQTDDSPIASYQFDQKLPKPCFHPLRTAAGREITGFQPPDHLWHRGLWFAIKFINQSNFWEEHPPYGIQKTVGQPRCEMSAPNTLRIVHDLQWTSQATGPVIDEHRTIGFTVLPNETRQIDWTTSLQPLQDLLLDRTPYTTWGGYGGLTFRAPYEVHGAGFLAPSGPPIRTMTGKPHPWAIFHAVVDGNPSAKISLGMIDHPDNPRSPSPWYGKTDERYGFMNAAFLFHEPMTVLKDRTLNFRYRVLYRDGWWEAEEFAKLAETFRNAGR